MVSYVDDYINSIESKNSQKVAQYVFKRIKTEDNIENYSVIQMEQLILDAKPNSAKEITTIAYILSSYSKWLYKNNVVDNDNAYQILQSLDKNLLWRKAKPYARKKFISFEQYKEIIKDIATYEEYNALYFELLFSCIYYGIYSDDLSVLANLRRSDIREDGTVTLREDNGHVYKIKIPEKLAKDLVELSYVGEWVRPNRSGLCHIKMVGVHSDSVFKVENRSSNSGSGYKFSYYSRLRKITKEYVGYPVLPLQLYVSGVMHRIKIELEKNNIPLEEAFVMNSRNKKAFLIVEKELTRSNSAIEVGNLREMVKSHLDVF
jgi:integrase